MKKDKVYLVGAGPGEAGLITVKGLEVLKQADVIIYDYLVDRRIIKEAKEGVELICCDKLGKKRYSDGFLLHQDRINKLILKKVKEGKKVVRLKNGDCAIFGRLSQELDFLVKNKIDFEIVPGITAASAASAYVGVPLTDRRYASSCVFVTGHEDPQKKESLLDWQSIAKQGTIVLYMAVENLEKIVKELLKAGKPLTTPCAIIQNATLLTQKVLVGNLKDIISKAKREKIRPPAIIVIGEVIKLEKNFNWLRKSKKVLFTGLSKERFFTKDIYFHLPLIKIEPLNDYKKLDKWVNRIAYSKLLITNSENKKNYQKSAITHKPFFDWIVFSSRFGVEYFFKRLFKFGYDARVLEGIKIAAIGSSTKNRLLDFGIIADLVPKEECSEGLLKEFKKTCLKNQRVLLPRSDIADKGLVDGLRKLNAIVYPVVAYKNVMPEDLPDLDFSFFDEIFFTSPSTVRNFIKRYGKPPKNVKIKTIGRVTENEARKYKII